ncbi:hypothetical protein EDC94DRAFT_645929 [Helicostylum pulchrum]|nr:hypothetical protein EDC94DRAFT_645929 [Helicostylum pulchrum]
MLQHLKLIHSHNFGSRGPTTQSLQSHPVQNSLFKALDSNGINRTTVTHNKATGTETDIALDSHKLCRKERKSLAKGKGKSKKPPKLIMFIGDKGTGVGSRIKGFRRYGGRWKEDIHGEATTLAHPVHQVVKGDQKFNRTSKGSFWCTNPLCVSVHYKRAIKSRDALSALAIGVVGLSTLLFGAEPSPFNDKISRASTEDYIIKT